ncbi:hypothetical protein BDF14DRAFT_1832275 [Spinellus fusiger]|nr:hypothetical protein BDF14DRAFT_1832275 [Spinellus fusiger]
MKFAKQIESAACDLPTEWRPHLICYKKLKKSIHHVVYELEDKGISSQLLANHSKDSVKLAYVYNGDREDPSSCLHITLHDPGVLTANASLQADLLLGLEKRMPRNPVTDSLELKIELMKDSEFIHLLLEELSHASVLYETE